MVRKDRHVMRQNWSKLRAEISRVCAEKNIPETEFRPLSLHESWKQIQDKIYHTFCDLTHFPQRPVWLWTDLKLDTYSIPNLDRPEQHLDKLIDENETVWYVVTETINEKDKFWFYEGKVKTIQTIIDESWFERMYIVSKKYEWLICINHHNNLIATGAVMPNRSRQLSL